MHSVVEEAWRWEFGAAGVLDPRADRHEGGTHGAGDCPLQEYDAWHFTFMRTKKWQIKANVIDDMITAMKSFSWLRVLLAIVMFAC